jgi:hypothetical protein
VDLGVIFGEGLEVHARMKVEVIEFDGRDVWQTELSERKRAMSFV